MTEKRGPRLPAFIANQLQGPNVPAHASRDFINFVKLIGESGSNHEEVRIVEREAAVLESRLKAPNIPVKTMKEYLIRLLYCEMLGKEVPFSYIHAIMFAQQKSLQDKRLGYLAVSLMLHEQHEQSVLLVNTIQRDLKSSNVVEVCMALTAITKMIGADMIPAVLPLVEDKIKHRREIVRKKAILALHRFYLKAPSSIAHLQDKIRQSLCDADHGVITASINLLHDMIVDDPITFKDLTLTFVGLLKQIVDNTLPKEFDYHRVPAPWLQVKLLRILAMLGIDDQSTSSSMYEILRDCLRAADIVSSVAYAVTYECIITITTIYPSSNLVELAGKAVARFLRSDNNNLKYLGINALASVVSVNASLAGEYKALVIDCLDDADETLKRKTLDLLCRMTNPANVKVITERLISYIQSTVDTYLRRDLVPRIVSLAERFAPDNMWYIETMNQLLTVAGDMVPVDTAHNLMRLIAEGTEDEEADEELRVFAAESYIDLLETPQLPDTLVHVICWVVGEYAYLATDYDQETVMELVCELLDRQFSDEDNTRPWVITSLVKLVAQTGLLPAKIRSALEGGLRHLNVEVQQRCKEAFALIRDTALLRDALPLDASCEDLEVDSSLPFLDGYVQQALAAGAKAYVPPERRVEAGMVIDRHEEPAPAEAPSVLNFQPYDAPLPRHLTSASTGSAPASRATGSALASQEGSSRQSPTESVAASGGPGAGDHPSSASGQGGSVSGRVIREPAGDAASTGLRVGTKRWGKKGDMLKTAAATAPTSSSAASVSATSESTTTQQAEDDHHGNSTGAENSSMSDRLTSQNDSVTASTSASASVAPVPSRTQPVMDERKARLADDIFAGTETASTRTAPKRMSRARRAKAGSASSQSSAGTQKVGNLLGDEDLLTSSASDHPSSLPAGSATKQAAQSDLLGDLLDLNLESSSDAAPPSYSQVESGEGHLLDMAMASSLTQPVGDSGDLLGGTSDLLFMGDAATAGNGGLLLPAASNVGDNRAANNDAQPSVSQPRFDLPENLAEYPCSAPVALVKTAGLVASAVKVWAPESLLVAFQIENTTSQTVGGIMTKLEVPAALCRVDEDAGNSFNVTLGAGERSVQVLSFEAGNAQSTSAGTAIRGNISWRESSSSSGGFGKARNISFNLVLTAQDLLREMDISIDEFGQRWQDTPAERVETIAGATAGAGIEACVAKLAPVGVRCLQIIGSEAVLASRVLNDDSAFILVHCEVAAGASLELRLRAGTSVLADFMVRQLSQAVKST